MDSPIMTSWGATCEERAIGEVILRLPELRPEHMGGGLTHALNGMVIAALFDAALGAARLSTLFARADAEGSDPAAIRQATVNLNVSYLKLAMGDAFETHASIVRSGKRIAFAEGRLYDENKELCATANGSYLLLG